MNSRDASSSALPSLLLVEDNLIVAQVFQRVLERHCRVTGAARVDDARAQLERFDFDVVLADFALPDGDGAAVLGHARRVRPAAIRLLMSGGDVPRREEYEREGLVQGWLPKPFHAEMFLALVRGRAGWPGVVAT